MIFLIIGAIIIFIIYSFQSDKKQAINRNLGRGGLARRFPNFVNYTRQAFTSSEPFLLFVKDDGRYLEYKFPVKGNTRIAGYYYLGIESVFGTFAYVYAISSSGVKINGYMRELHNGRNNNIPLDRTIDEYEIIFDGLISQMESREDFEKKFYGISSSNIYKQFDDLLIDSIAIDIIKTSSSEVKNEISFDKFLCNAIKTGEKIEIRTADNLSGINIDPNKWKLKAYDFDAQGAIFSSDYFPDDILIKFPYIVDRVINIFDCEFPNIIDSRVKIKNVYIQRLQDVSQTDARNEGFGAYTEKIKELENRDPSIDAEYCLFIDDWTEKYNTSLFRNHWLWAFEIEMEVEIAKSVKATASSAGLSQAEVEALLEATI